MYWKVGMGCRGRMCGIVLTLVPFGLRSSSLLFVIQIVPVGEGKKKRKENRELTWKYLNVYIWLEVSLRGKTLAKSAAVSEAVFSSGCLLALAPYSWNSADNHQTVSQCQRLLASWNEHQRLMLQVALANRGRRQKMWKTAASNLLLALFGI